MRTSSGQPSVQGHRNGLWSYGRVAWSVRAPSTASWVAISPILLFHVAHLVRSASVASPAIAHVLSCSANSLPITWTSTIPFAWTGSDAARAGVFASSCSLLP